MHEYLKLEDKTLQNVHQFSFERAKNTCSQPLPFKSFMHIDVVYICLFTQLSVFSFLTSRYTSSPLSLILVCSFSFFLI